MASFEINGGNTKVVFEYEATTAKIQSIIEDVAESIWPSTIDEDGNPTSSFPEATNSEKLDAVDAYVKKVLLEKANSGKSNKAQTLARETEAGNPHTI